MFVIGLINLAEDPVSHQTDERLYIKHSTMFRVQDISQLENGNLCITTSKIVENFSVLTDAWHEVSFSLEYDVNHKEARELLDNLEYPCHISILDFMLIKAKHRKLYKFTASEALKITHTIKRQLDMNYYDVWTLKRLYYGKVSKYENMRNDVKHFTTFLELDKEEYERNTRELEKYEQLSKRLLDEMDSEEGESGETANKISSNNNLTKMIFVKDIKECNIWTK